MSSCHKGDTKMVTKEPKPIVGAECLLKTSDSNWIRGRILSKLDSGKYKIVVLQPYKCYHVGDEVHLYPYEIKPFKPKMTIIVDANGKIVKALSNLEVSIKILDNTHPDHLNQYIMETEGLYAKVI